MDSSYYHLHAQHEETYWWWVAKNRIIMSLVDRFVPPGPPGGHRPRACDIGCGCGGLLKLLAERFDVTGTDMAPLAREYCAKRGFTALDGSLPDNLPFSADRGDAFDLIVVSEVLEHVEQDRAAAAAIVRLLKPGGVLVCTVPAHQWMWSSHDVYNHHFRRYTRSSFAAIFEGQPVDRLVLSYANSAMFLPMAAVRIATRIVHGTEHKGEQHGPEIKPLPAVLNTPLTGLFAAERHLIPHVSLPLGSSVVAAFRRRATVTVTARHADAVAGVALAAR